MRHQAVGAIGFLTLCAVLAGGPVFDSTRAGDLPAARRIAPDRLEAGPPASLHGGDRTGVSPGWTVPSAPGAVTASGVLPGDTTWSGEVLVTGDVTVPAGATLTVEPGAVVRFAALSDDTAGGEDPDLYSAVPILNC
jgi:hypothetical protein